MGGKSLNTRHANRVARAKIAKRSASSYQKNRPEVEPAPVSRSETICQKCGFKATYKFIRCPSCDEVQE